MKTPFGIHAEYVSERAVNNCVNMYKKDAHKIVPGKIGRNQDVIPEYKDSLDCPIDINEIGRLKIWHKEIYISSFTVKASGGACGLIKK